MARKQPIQEPSTKTKPKAEKQSKPQQPAPVATSKTISVSPGTAQALAVAASILQSKRQQYTKRGENFKLGANLQKYEAEGKLVLDNNAPRPKKRKQPPQPSSSANRRQMKDDDNDDDSSDDDLRQSYDPSLHEHDIYGVGQEDLEELTHDLMNAHTVRDDDDELEDLLLEKRITRPDMNNNMNQRKIKRQKIMDLDKEKRDTEARLKRTLFIGNVSIDTKDTDLKKLLAPLEVKIESIRFRGATYSTTKLPRWVAFAHKQFNEHRDTMNAFIVLETEEMAAKCLQLHNTELHGKHLRVDIAANRGEIDHTRGVFVGNLPFDITEETLYTIFAAKCNNEIDTVRCVRDKQTGMGKGFAFVTFTEKMYVPEALKLHETTPDAIGRVIRVVRIPPNAFDKTESFKAQLTKNRLRAEQERKAYQAQKQAEKRKQEILGSNYRPPTKQEFHKAVEQTIKKVKVQGAFQKTFQSNSAVSVASGRVKKPRHQPRPGAATAAVAAGAFRRIQNKSKAWMGVTARQGDGLGRNKATKSSDPHKKKKTTAAGKKK